MSESFDVRAPLDVTYAHFTLLEQFSAFMPGIVSVRQLDEVHLRFESRAVGHERGWTAQIVSQQPGRLISWRSVNRHDRDGHYELDHAGVVFFDELQEDVTRVTVQLDVCPFGLAETLAVRCGLAGRWLRDALHAFADHVADAEMAGVRPAGWQGEIAAGQLVDPADPAVLADPHERVLAGAWA